jgi:hypothetical protein
LVKFEFGFAISIHAELIITDVQAFDSTTNFEARVHRSGVRFPVRIQLVLIHAINVFGRGRSMQWIFPDRGARFGLEFPFYSS